MTALVLLPRSSPSTEKQFHNVSSRPARSSVPSDSASNGRIGKRHVADTDRTSSSESARLDVERRSVCMNNLELKSCLPDHGCGKDIVHA
jgi:hypothetical protein